MRRTLIWLLIAGCVGRWAGFGQVGRVNARSAASETTAAESAARADVKTHVVSPPMTPKEDASPGKQA